MLLANNLIFIEINAFFKRAFLGNRTGRWFRKMKPMHSTFLFFFLNTKFWQWVSAVTHRRAVKNEIWVWAETLKVTSRTRWWNFTEIADDSAISRKDRLNWKSSQETHIDYMLESSSRSMEVEGAIYQEWNSIIPAIIALQWRNIHSRGYPLISSAPKTRIQTLNTVSLVRIHGDDIVFHWIDRHLQRMLLVGWFIQDVDLMDWISFRFN